MVISCLCGGCYLVGFFVAGCALHSLDLLDYVSYYKPVISTLQARVLIRHRIVTFQDCAGSRVVPPASPSADSCILQWLLALSYGKVTAIRKAARHGAVLHAGCTRFAGALRSERSCNEPDVFHVRDYCSFSGMVVAKLLITRSIESFRHAKTWNKRLRATGAFSYGILGASRLSSGLFGRKNAWQPLPHRATRSLRARRLSSPVSARPWA